MGDIPMWEVAQTKKLCSHRDCDLVSGTKDNLLQLFLRVLLCSSGWLNCDPHDSVSQIWITVEQQTLPLAKTNQNGEGAKGRLQF